MSGLERYMNNASPGIFFPAVRRIHGAPNIPCETWLGANAMEEATRAKRARIWKVFMVVVTIIIYFVLKMV
jgi:hypothetical protein